MKRRRKERKKIRLNMTENGYEKRENEKKGIREKGEIRE